MDRVEIRYGDGEELLRDYLNDFACGGLFVETEEAYEIGDPIELLLVFPEIEEGLTIAGRVEWRRSPAKWRSVLKPGVGVSFDPAHRSRIEFLLDYSQGTLDRLRKQGRRVPVEMDVHVLSEGKLLRGRSRDLSRGGIYVSLDQTLDLHAMVDLYLFVEPLSQPEKYQGRIAWRKDSYSDSGVGIEFRFGSPSRRKRVGDLVSGIENRLSRK